MTTSAVFQSDVWSLLAILRNLAASDRADDARLREMANAVVPTFSDFCLVDARAALDPSLRFVTAHENPETRAAVERLSAALGARDGLFPSAIEAAKGQVIANRVERLLEDQPRAIADEGTTRTLSVPLRSRGRIVGVATFGRNDREFSREEIEIGSEIGFRFAVAIDLAREATRSERIQSSKTAMLGALVHDVRTPLSTIGMVTARMRKNPVIVDAARAETDVLVRTVGRVDAFLRTLVDCIRLDAGTLRIETRSLDLAETVEAAVEALRPAAGARVLQYECADTGPFDVIGDTARLRQVLDRLLSNAIKFTEENGSILVRVSKSGAEYVVSVSDSGCGIPSDQVEELFVPSWTGPAKDPYARGNAKMGLYVSRGLVEAHGGRLWAESASGQGSTFSFSVPRADSASDSKSRLIAASRPRA